MVIIGMVRGKYDVSMFDGVGNVQQCDAGLNEGMDWPVLSVQGNKTEINLKCVHRVRSVVV
jgi:hypothetical protein